MIGRAAEDDDIELSPLKSVGCGDNGGPEVGRHLTALYRAWPARNKFFCGGLLMTGECSQVVSSTEPCACIRVCDSYGANICVWVSVLGPCAVYFLWVLPDLVREGSYALPTVIVVTFLLTIGSLLAVCCSDPGIIPRREVILATGSRETLCQTLGYDPLGSEERDEDGLPGVPQELRRQGYRACWTCHIVRPPNAAHCYDCGNCVIRFDHHCPFVNNCVGQRNYRFFFAFVSSVWCLALLVLPSIFYYCSVPSQEDAIKDMRILSSGALRPILYILACAGTLIAVAALLSLLLWVYHVFLIATNRTTKEHRREIANVTDEPTLLAPRGPPLFDPWALVDPRDLVRVTGRGRSI